MDLLIKAPLVKDGTVAANTQRPLKYIFEYHLPFFFILKNVTM